MSIVFSKTTGSQVVAEGIEPTQPKHLIYSQTRLSNCAAPPLMEATPRCDVITSLELGSNQPATPYESGPGTLPDFQR